MTGFICRVGLVVFLFILILFAQSRDARAENAANPKGQENPNSQSTGVKVRVDLPVDKEITHIEGRLTQTGIPLQHSYGSSEIRVDKLKLLRVDRIENGVPHILLEMIDGTRFNGTAKNEPIAIETTDGRKLIELTEGLEVHVVSRRETGILAAILGLLTLAIMEIVLGIDNIIFLAIVAGKLPVEQQPRARRFGLAAALGTRLLLLLSLTWLLGLTKPLFTLPEMPLLQDAEARNVSWRDIILLVGGVFLIGKSVHEMHEKLEHAKADAAAKPRKAVKFWAIIVQIALIDILFSLDSVITAVGMVDQIWVMITAMLIAVGVMLMFAEPISRFVDRHPAIKVLALSFLILIGVLLVAEGLGQHVDKGYIYFAMAFAVAIELINMKLRKAAK